MSRWHAASCSNIMHYPPLLLAFVLHCALPDEPLPIPLF